MKGTRRLVFISMLVAQAMVLGFFERFIPMPIPIPGVKIGFANIVTLTAIYTLTFKEALAIVLLRTLLVATTFGSMSSFLYALAGGLLSLCVMALARKISFDKLSITGISILGAIAHNLGQLMMAGFIIQSPLIISYLPILMIAAIPTGLFVGMVTKYLLNYLDKAKLFTH